MPTFEEKLDALIASQDHIRPEDVTLEYIRQQRSQAPDPALDFSTRYGGYIKGSAQRVLTSTQAKKIVSAAYEFLARFAARKHGS
jgi:hypothetical protein